MSSLERIQQLIPQPATPTTVEAFTGLKLAERASAERPYLICNMVSTLDGKATIEGKAGPISDKIDREIFHLLRTQTDALLVGAGTVRIERYGPLTKNDQLAAIRSRDGLRRPQLAVLVTNTLELDPEIPLLADSNSEVVIFTTQSAGDTKDYAADVTLIQQPGERVDLAKAMQVLRSEFAVRSVLCEGGPTLNGELLQADLLDELFLSLAGKIEGGSGLPSIVEGSPLAEVIDFQLLAAFYAENSLYLRYGR